MKHPNSILGFIKRHPDGFGFFIPDDVDHPDVYIPRQYMRGVMTNDRIEVQVQKEPGGERFRGKVLRILERSVTQVMGQLHRTSEDEGILLDASCAWGENLHVILNSELSFQDGDWVSVEIISYPQSEEGFWGKLIAVIGDSLNPLNDTLRVLYQHQIPIEFSEECLEQARQLGHEVRKEDYQDRVDLREKAFITIDGATAKDFDDAIFVEKSAQGFRLMVAIADVSHYVPRRSPIDKDAYVRGTSTYFPNYVVPMLPEALSNELCSLKPRVDRLVVVSDMQFNFQGEMIDSQAYEAVIHSQARVTYGEAQEVIDKNEVPSLEHVKANILLAADLAKILMHKRYREGSLNLEIPETTIELDETGQPIDIIKAERLFAHKLIEEMMLAANVAIAKIFKAKEIPSLYRIHEPPNGEAIEALENYMHNFGFEQKLSGGRLQKKITTALQEFEGKPQHQILSILTLRSMSQAKYAEENVGHFGLGFEDYVHFTSPIRRYPDLIVHRQLKSLICRKKGYVPYTQEELISAGSQMSACEQRSVKAERQLQSIKKARFMERFIGHNFEGMISSVAKFGVFVVLRQYDVDGLVKLEELGGDYFEFDEEHLILRGKKTGKTYSLGDNIHVLVAAVDPDEGRIDFVLEGKYIPPTPQLKSVSQVKTAQQLKTTVKGKKVGKSQKKTFSKKGSSPSSSRLTLKTNSRGLRQTRVSKSRGKNKSR